jgi:hypothetical protein
MLLFLPFNTWAVNNQKKHARNEGRHSKTILTIFDMLEIIFFTKVQFSRRKKRNRARMENIKNQYGVLSIEHCLSMAVVFP